MVRQVKLYLLMGRKNYESIPEKYRPLPNRTNIVVTRQAHWFKEGVYFVSSIEEGIDIARDAGEEELFIIGGGEIYRQSLSFVDVIVIKQEEEYRSGKHVGP